MIFIRDLIQPLCARMALAAGTRHQIEQALETLWRLLEPPSDRRAQFRAVYREPFNDALVAPRALRALVRPLRRRLPPVAGLRPPRETRAGGGGGDGEEAAETAEVRCHPERERGIWRLGGARSHVSEPLRTPDPSLTLGTDVAKNMSPYLPRPPRHHPVRSARRREDASVLYGASSAIAASITHAHGRKASKALEDARIAIARFSRRAAAGDLLHGRRDRVEQHRAESAAARAIISSSRRIEHKSILAAGEAMLDAASTLRD